MSAASCSSSRSESRSNSSSRERAPFRDDLERGLDPEDGRPKLMSRPGESHVHPRRPLLLPLGPRQQRQRVVEECADHLDPALQEGLIVRHEHDRIACFPNRDPARPHGMGESPSQIGPLTRRRPCPRKHGAHALVELFAFLSVQARDGREGPRTLVVAPPDRDGHAELTPEGAGDDVESDFRPIRLQEVSTDIRDALQRLHFLLQVLSLGEAGEHTREVARHGRERAGSILDGVPPCLDLEDSQRGLPADEGEERDPQVRRPRQIEVRVRPRLESHAPGRRLRAVELSALTLTPDGAKSACSVGSCDLYRCLRPDGLADPSGGAGSGFVGVARRSQRIGKAFNHGRRSTAPRRRASVPNPLPFIRPTGHPDPPTGDRSSTYSGHLRPPGRGCSGLENLRHSD